MLNASHAVNCVPGTQAVSGKSMLIASLAAAYGEAAWGIVPLSFRLPSQYARMAAHIKQVGWMWTGRAGQDASVLAIYCNACCTSPPTPAPAVLPPTTCHRHPRPLSSAGAAQRGQLSVGTEGGCAPRQGGGRGHTPPSAGASAGPRPRWRQRLGLGLGQWVGQRLELGRAWARAQLQACGGAALPGAAVLGGRQALLHQVRWAVQCGWGGCFECVCVGVCVAIRLVDWGLAVACRQLPLSVACPSPLAAPDIFACPCSNLAAGCGRC
jgi:hypothetical protein